MPAKRMIAFDLDGTLAVSKSPLTDDAAGALRDLLCTYEVCIISGGQFQQFDEQVIARLHASPEQLARLHLMPVSGTQYHRFDVGASHWTRRYADELSPEQRASIIDVLETGASELGLTERPAYGARIEDRGSQITFSGLGQEAPPEEKLRWDPDGTKRESLRAYAAPKLPDLEVRVGGSTSVDVTAKGRDKAYGIGRLMTFNSLGPGDVLFFGDKLEPGGNDHPVTTLGIDCIAVSDPMETVVAIRAIVAVS